MNLEIDFLPILAVDLPQETHILEDYLKKPLPYKKDLFINLVIFLPQNQTIGKDDFFCNIKVRLPNIGRQKGESREVEINHKIWCYPGYLVVKKVNGDLIKNFQYLPDREEINKIIKFYRKIGCCSVRFNILPLSGEYYIDHKGDTYNKYFELFINKN